MKDKVYYKLVSKRNKKYFSAFVNKDDQVEYIKNKWVTISEKSINNGYGLFVFDSKENIKKFINEIKRYYPNRFSKFLLFKCHIKGEYEKIPDIKNIKGVCMVEYVKVYGRETKIDIVEENFK